MSYSNALAACRAECGERVAAEFILLLQKMIDERLMPAPEPSPEIEEAPSGNL